MLEPFAICRRVLLFLRHILLFDGAENKYFGAFRYSPESSIGNYVIVVAVGICEVTGRRQRLSPCRYVVCSERLVGKRFVA